MLVVCSFAGRLIGTLAHEVMSITAQLLACYDDEAGAQANPCFTPDPPSNGPKPSGAGTDPGGNGSVDAPHGCEGRGASRGAGASAGANGARSVRGGGQGSRGAGTQGADASGAGGGPVAASALLAHLLFLRANGGLAGATALADTFGTTAFAAAAAAARVPDEFADDMRALHPAEPPVPQGARCSRVLICCRFGGWAGAAMHQVGLMSAWEHRATANALLL